MLACTNHKLPQSGGSGSRHSLGVQGRLDDRQVFQFQWQLIGFEGFLEDGQIEIGCSKHVTDGVAQAPTIAVDELLHHIVVRQFHHRRNPAQALYVHLLGIDRVHILHLAVAGIAQIGLRHIQVHQAVQVVGHRLGELYHFLVSLVVGDGYLVFA